MGFGFVGSTQQGQCRPNHLELEDEISRLRHEKSDLEVGISELRKKNSTLLKGVEEMIASYVEAQPTFGFVYQDHQVRQGLKNL